MTHLKKPNIPLTKKILIIPALVLVFIALVLSGMLLRSDSRKFTDFTNDLFIAELSANTLNMHYTLAYPESYGISYEPHLSVYTSDNQANSITELENMLHFLAGISPEKLSETDAYTYDLLTLYLNNTLERSHLSLYDEPLSPSSGAQTGLPILLADYSFRSAKDIEDYLTILNEIDDYLAGLIRFEQEKALAGLFMSDYSVQKVIEQCDTIMDPAALASGEHFLCTTFAERLQPLVEEGIITQADMEHYISDNDRILTTVVAPAYEKTGDSLLLLKGSGDNSSGLSHYPQGKEYYRLLLQSSTGSYRDIEEVKKMLYENFEANYNALIQLASSYSQISDTPLRELPLPDFESPDAILSHLQEKMQTDYPAFPLLEDTEYPRYTVKNVSDLMSPYCSPAYYLTPPIDDTSENIIYINTDSTTDTITLYTTLAHEGYPGHLYQTVYSQLYLNQTGDNLMRHLLNYGGYVEGWALYVEMSSYDYLKEYTADTNEQSAYLYEYCRLNRAIQLCLYSLLDIAIHYEGASELQVQKILSSIGITNTDTANAIYQYIVEEPVTYLKYYLGYLEILELKDKARILQGADYSDYQFHKFLLEAGPSDFINLEKRLIALAP